MCIAVQLAPLREVKIEKRYRVLCINREDSELMRKTAHVIRDIWIYFKTGHSTYLVYSMSILNFVVLQHRLLISYIPFLSQYLGRLSHFILLFAITYIPIAVLIGFYEFRKGEIRRRPMLNPYTQANLEATMRMNKGLLNYINGNIEEAKMEIEKSLHILHRWRKE
jgi:hypothetical protein